MTEEERKELLKKIAEAEKDYMPLEQRMQEQNKVWLKSLPKRKRAVGPPKFGVTSLPADSPTSLLYRAWDEGKITEAEFRAKMKKLEDEAFGVE